MITYKSFVPELTSGRTALVAGLASIWNHRPGELPDKHHILASLVVASSDVRSSAQSRLCVPFLPRKWVLRRRGFDALHDDGFVAC
jgi:hypothetical protein